MELPQHVLDEVNRVIGLMPQNKTPEIMRLTDAGLENSEIQKYLGMKSSVVPYQRSIDAYRGSDKKMSQADVDGTDRGVRKLLEIEMTPEAKQHFHRLHDRLVSGAMTKLSTRATSLPNKDDESPQRI